MKRQRLTYRDVEERAKAEGASISSSAVFSLANPKEPMKRGPTEEILEGLSAGLGVMLPIVWRAAARSLRWQLDLHLTDKEAGYIAVLRKLPEGERRAIEDMTERDWRTILRMLDVIRRGDDEENR